MNHLLLGLGLTLLVSFLDIRQGISVVWAYDLQSAQSALKQKDYDKVIEVLSPEVDKLNREALFVLAKAYSSANKHEAAVKAYTACLALNSKDYEAKTLIGAEQLVSKKDREALATLKEALDINPRFVPAYRLLIRYYEKKNNKYEQRLLYEDWVAKVGESSEALSKLCELTATAGLYDLSSKYCQRSITSDAQNPSNYVYLGISYKETGQSEKAEENLKKAAQDFVNSNLAQFTYAQFLDERKNFITSYTYYKRAVAADPQSVPSLLGLGNSSLEIQKYSESLEAFTKACSLDRKTRPSFRRAAGQLHSMKIEDWYKKFETQLEKCG